MKLQAPPRMFSIGTPVSLRRPLRVFAGRSPCAGAPASDEPRVRLRLLHSTGHGTDDSVPVDEDLGDDGGYTADRLSEQPVLGWRQRSLRSWPRAFDAQYFGSSIRNSTCQRRPLHLCRQSTHLRICALCTPEPSSLEHKHRPPAALPAASSTEPGSRHVRRGSAPITLPPK